MDPGQETGSRVWSVSFQLPGEASYAPTRHGSASQAATSLCLSFIQPWGAFPAVALQESVEQTMFFDPDPDYFIKEKQICSFFNYEMMVLAP